MNTLKKLYLLYSLLLFLIGSISNGQENPEIFNYDIDLNIYLYSFTETDITHFSKTIRNYLETQGITIRDIDVTTYDHHKCQISNNTSKGSQKIKNSENGGIFNDRSYNNHLSFEFYGKREYKDHNNSSRDNTHSQVKINL